MSYASLADHRTMALDRARNDAYAAALRDVVGSDTVVLDLGAGTGVLGLIAARMGAKRVYLVEPEDVVVVSEEIARANGLDRFVRLVQGRIEDVRLPEPVDVIVSAFTGNFLLAEDLLPTLFLARDRLLRPGGVLIPDAATMEAVPVSAAELYGRYVSGWSERQQGLDLGAGRAYAGHTIFFRAQGVREAAWLAEPAELAAMDLNTASEATVHTCVTHEIAESGICHGWVGWFSMRLGERWLSTSPRAQPLHWSPAFLPLDPPLPFECGERVSFALDRTAHGDWTWRVEARAGTQQHSTLLSVPMSPSTIQRAALDWTPSLSASGEAAAHVLARCDGSQSVDAIARTLASRFPERYATHAEALDFVQKLVRRYA
jgi:SAM-dependent methyltransferase